MHATGGADATGGSVNHGSGGEIGSGGHGAGSGGVSSSGGTSSSGGMTGSGGAAGHGGATTGAGGTAGGAGATGLSGAPGSGGAGGTGLGTVAAGVRWIGRVDLTDAQHPRFAWSGTGFVARFMGTSLAAQLNNGGSATIFKAVVDGSPQPVIRAGSGQASYTLASGLGFGVHTVELYKQTEGAQGNAQLMGLTVGGGGALMPPPEPPARFLEIVGDSITCGYGTLGKLADSDCFPTESHWDTYGAVAARALGAELSTIATSGQGAYRNYGGDMMNTMPMVYDRTLTNAATPTWDFRVVPQAVVINLGTNDISNNKGDPGDAFRDTYVDLLTTIRTNYPDAWIIGIIGPLLSGTDLTTIQGHIKDAVDIRTADGDQKVEYFGMIQPQTSDKFACQYHPNVAENMIMATQLAGELSAKLGW
jgi:lysophospholipase L1-like esterase